MNKQRDPTNKNGGGENGWHLRAHCILARDIVFLGFVLAQHRPDMSVSQTCYSRSTVSPRISVLISFLEIWIFAEDIKHSELSYLQRMCCHTKGDDCGIWIQTDDWIPWLMAEAIDGWLKFKNHDWSPTFMAEVPQSRLKYTNLMAEGDEASGSLGLMIVTCCRSHQWNVLE